MKKLVQYFLQGTLYIAPIAVTVYLIIISFTWLDNLLRDLKIFQEGWIAKYSFPGIGLLMILGSITIIGFIGQKLITAPISNFFIRILDKAPLIKVIYTSVKDLLSAFVGKEKKFDKPVLVQLDQEGILNRLGFITTTDLSNLGIFEKTAVYLPSSYGVLGELYIVPSDKITHLEANSAEMMKFIVSGGVAKLDIPEK